MIKVVEKVDRGPDIWCRRKNDPTRESVVPSWAAHMMPILQHA